MRKRLLGERRGKGRSSRCGSSTWGAVTRQSAWEVGVTYSSREVAEIHKIVGDGAAEEDLACLGCRSSFDISGELNAP